MGGYCTMARPWTYHFDSINACLNILNGRNSRKIGNNTVLEKDSDSIGEYVAVRHWATQIVRYYNDRIVIDCDGYHTVTTLLRLKGCLPHGTSIYSDRKYGRLLYVEQDTYVFEDGIAIHNDGRVTVGDEPAVMPLCDEVERATGTRPGNEDEAVGIIEGLDDGNKLVRLFRGRFCRPLVARHCRPNYLPLLMVHCRTDEHLHRVLESRTRE
jgi:hypothetical protein